MDSNINQKINNFSAIILSDAQKKRLELEKANNRTRNERVQAARNEIQNETDEKVRHTVSNIKKTANERVINAELNEKKELLKKREYMIKSIFDEAEDRVCQYINTESYRQWLEDKVKNIYNEVYPQIYYVREEDIELVKNVLCELGEDGPNVIKADDEKFLGGIRVKSANILIDFSFGELLQNQKDNFLQMSELTF